MICKALTSGHATWYCSYLDYFSVSTVTFLGGTDTEDIGVTFFIGMAWDSRHQYSLWGWSFGAEYRIYIVTYSIIPPCTICLWVAALHLHNSLGHFCPRVFFNGLRLLSCFYFLSHI